MKDFSITIAYADIAAEVYRLTANAAMERGDGLHSATEDNAEVVNGFISDGGKFVRKAFGRYMKNFSSENGFSVDYSMPDNWKEAETEIKELCIQALVYYSAAKWLGLSGGDGGAFLTVMSSALELLETVLDKRKKPIRE